MTGTVQALETEFGAPLAAPKAYRDGIPTFWAHRDQLHRVLAFLKQRIPSPYQLLYDLTAIDERTRTHHPDDQHGDFTLVYHLFSFDRNEYIRVKTPLNENALSVDTITDLWPAANWYEREVWDMFGISFSGHPHLTRILMPRTWEGHPLRKDIRLVRRRWENSGCRKPKKMPSKKRCGSAPRNGA
jgi:NADH-quinone oxidoreductase subunit C/D